MYISIYRVLHFEEQLILFKTLSFQLVCEDHISSKEMSQRWIIEEVSSSLLKEREKVFTYLIQAGYDLLGATIDKSMADYLLNVSIIFLRKIHLLFTK